MDGQKLYNIIHTPRLANATKEDNRKNNAAKQRKIAKGKQKLEEEQRAISTGRQVSDDLDQGVFPDADEGEGYEFQDDEFALGLAEGGAHLESEDPDKKEEAHWVDAPKTEDIEEELENRPIKRQRFEYS